MNFFNYDNLTQLHIELTNACNAACPMCQRFFKGSTLMRPDLEIEQITYDQFVEWFPPEVIEKLEVVLFCGVHGDPGMAKDLYEICEYIANSSPDVCIRMHTNGGMRKPEFWSKLGSLFAKRKKPWWEWRVIFSIDGLEDTNHLYRRNVEWNKLIENVKAFINAGGMAEWDYLVFKHNEHQIDEAKQLAKKLGFSNFIPKKALGVDDGTSLVRMSAVNRNGELDYWIEAPEKPENRNLANPTGETKNNVYLFTSDEYKKLKETKENLNWHKNSVDKVYNVIKIKDLTHYDVAEIDCKAETFHGGREIFIDNQGRVMPCCYIGTHLISLNGDLETLQLHYEVENYGWDFFDLKKHTLKDILDGNHLNAVFADSWNKPSVKEGKLAYCAMICDSGRYSGVDKIYTHDKMDAKERNWRAEKKAHKISKK